ncbi:MAG TPA: DUF4870 domain-containing protein [Pyrinomonadaceae bacterium]|jgi:uncharacterized membrane protein|nr:DUF4870 domain-containing protein [Pyrinomonadaceae bacterium]
MQNPPPVQTAPAKSSTGLDENLAALLSYIATWVSGLVFFLIEKDSRLVRFHAMQAILLGAAATVGAIVLWILWAIVTVILAQIADILGTLAGLIIGLVIFVFYLAVLVGWVLCLIKSYQGQFYKLPVLGNFAEKFSTK